MYTHACIHIYIYSQANKDSLFWAPPLRWHVPSGLCSSALVITIASVASRSSGWTHSRLQTSIRGPQTCYLYLTDYICMCVHVKMCICICMYVYRYIYIYTSTHIYTVIYTYTHLHTYIHIHTYITLH